MAKKAAPIPSVSGGFTSVDEEASYLTAVKGEMDISATKAEVADIWTRHYLKVGHRKLGRLLLGQTVDSAMRTRSRKR